MRARLLQASLVVLLFTSIVAQAAQKSLIVTGDNVVLRNGANKHTHRLALLSKGQPLRLLELTQKGGFFHVETAETEGWVSSDFAQIVSLDSATEDEELPDLAPATPAEVNAEQTNVE